MQSCHVCVYLLVSRYYAVFKVLAGELSSSLTIRHIAEFIHDLWFYHTYPLTKTILSLFFWLLPISNQFLCEIFSRWRLADSNRWHPACKAGALPTELNPHVKRLKSEYFKRQSIFVSFFSFFCPFQVGHPGLEPGTSPLSGVRSNHLS